MPRKPGGVTNKPQGSGLGLNVVRQLVRQHHGTVSYTTKPGKRTTFHLKFPTAGAGPSKNSPRITAAAIGEIDGQDNHGSFKP
jgi:K+-sensing histidine kinase KdpD